MTNKASLSTEHLELAVEIAELIQDYLFVNMLMNDLDVAPEQLDEGMKQARSGFESVMGYHWEGTSTSTAMVKNFAERYILVNEIETDLNFKYSFFSGSKTPQQQSTATFVKAIRTMITQAINSQRD